MDKRHFTVVIGSKEHGLYVSSTPSSAAKKAVSKLCASNKSKKVEFYLREITQDSKKKTYGPYLGEMKKLKIPIKLKGRVIQYETIVHLKKKSTIKTVEKMGKKMQGGLYKCLDDAKIIGKLCDEDDSGEYDNIINCERKCLDKKLETELNVWKLLFEWSSENLPNNPIYCKGGSALGLEVLKSILNINLDQSKYDEFVDLNLIKDWDFTVFMSEDEKKDFIDFAQTIGFNLEGKIITILRFTNALKIGEDYLLELSVKTDQSLDDLELPLTNLKFEVNSGNIDKFFEIVKMYVKNEKNLERMLEILNELLSDILVNGMELADSIENGLYTITDSGKISTAGLSDELLGIIDESVGISNSGLNSRPIRNSNRSFNNGPIGIRNNREHINPLTMKQFLITQFSQPDRLFLRFLKKNKKKSKKIRKFYEKNGIPLPPWLIDQKILEEIKLKISRFLNNFNQYIESKIQMDDKFFENPKPGFKKFIDEMDILLQGINISNLKLNNPLIDLGKVEKLIPMNIFEDLKKNLFEKSKTKNDIELSKRFEGKDLEKKKLEKNRRRIESFRYDNFLPSGKNMAKSNTRVKPVYDSFLRTFLSKI
jgi:hypothetical protein